MGALHYGLRTVWLAVGTASLGPSGKKDPGWCRGTLPGASLQTVSLCSFLGYSNCPTFPKGSSGVSHAQQAQCWPPTWLKLYIYIFFGHINHTTRAQPSLDSQRCLCAFLRPGAPQLWPASLSSAPVWFGLCELGKHQGPSGSQLAHPHRVGLVPLCRSCPHCLV